MASSPINITVSFLFTVFGGPGLILVYLPWTLTRFQVPVTEAMWQRALALAVIALGLTPLLESIVRFVRVGKGTLMPAVPTERLVITGLYRYVRNPMYVGVMTALIGEVILLPSRSMAEYAIAVFIGFELFILLYEEPALRRKYGGEYNNYCRRVHRWWPRLRADV